MSGVVRPGMRRGHGSTRRPPAWRQFVELVDAGLLAAVAVTVVLTGFAVFVAFDQPNWSLGFWGSLVSLLLLGGGAWALVVEGPFGMLRERLGWPQLVVRVLKFLMLVPFAAVIAALAALDEDSRFGDNFVVWCILLVVPAFALSALSEFFHRPGGKAWIGPVVWGSAFDVAGVLALIGGLQIPGQVG